MQRAKGQKLTIKEKKYAAAKVAGKSNREAYKLAGYSTNMKKTTLDVAASQILKREGVQAAIDSGLAHAGLSPEYAIEQLAKIVNQDDEYGAKRLAIKDVLELHGWNRAERPQVHVKFEGGFFQAARGRTGVIDGEAVDVNEA